MVAMGGPEGGEFKLLHRSGSSISTPRVENPSTAFGALTVSSTRAEGPRDALGDALSGQLGQTRAAERGDVGLSAVHPNHRWLDHHML